MRKHKGFTLMEVVLALSTILMISSFFYQGRANLLRRPQIDLPTVEWYLMLRELENPDHHFALVAVNPTRRLTMVSQKPGGKMYYVTFAKGAGILQLQTGRRGIINLMKHVRSFHVEMNHVMTITTDRGEVFTAKLLIPDKGVAKDETTVGRHSVVSR